MMIWEVSHVCNALYTTDHNRKVETITVKTLLHIMMEV